MKIELDDGFLFGKGAFETIKVVNGAPLFLKEHLNRLKSSLEFFGIDRKIDTDEIYKYIEDSDEKNFALKIIASDKNFIITSRPDNYRDDYKSFRLKISDARRNSSSKMIYHKNLCYYENIYEHRLAASFGYDNALFLNERGEVSECDFSNIFFVKGDMIYTPPLSSGLLRGTMREYLMEIFKIEERVIKRDEIKNFDECFISNSLMGIRSVESIDDFEFKKFDEADKILKNLQKFGF
ncbi:aminotransferase class IV [Peptoniphilus sp.]|jgi:4-amino-4-deoxychorismate lyase|uniref:aminotransferase class IV n=1 Tax=Peptoniphilus sp. TaxID=1971214 RepID=UPI003D90D287